MTESPTSLAPAPRAPRRRALIVTLLTILVAEIALFASLRQVGWWGTGDNLKWIASAMVAAAPLAIAALIFLRRRFRFSLRVLLAAVTLAALFIVLSVRPLLEARSARQASPFLAASGVGHYLKPTNDEFLTRIGYKPWPHLASPTARGGIPAWLEPLARELAAFPPDDAILEVTLQGDAQINAFVLVASRLKNLEGFGVYRSSPRGMANLQQAIPKLKTLKFAHVGSSVPIPDGWLTSLTNVRYLSIWAEGSRMGSPLPDQHLQDVARLPNLEVLLLFGYDVNSNVMNLAGSKSLKFIVLRHSNVTKAGRRELERSLPGCKVLGD